MNKITTERLPVKLTLDEMREFGQRVARIAQEKTDLEDEKKEVAANFKKRIDTKDHEISGLCHCINSEREFRDVETKTQFNNSERTVSVIRCDTREIVRIRPMTPEEQQGVFDFIADTD